MAKNINTTFVSDAIKEYVSRGFGSMTKKDFESWTC